MLPALAAWSPLRLRVLPAAVTTLDPSRQTIPTAALPTSETSPNAANVAPATQQSATAANAPRRAISPWRLAATIWALIALAVGAWLAFGFLAVRRIVRRARPLDDREWSGPLYEIADRLGIDEAPRLLCSESVKMPFACGLLSPCIILPAESDGWNLERRRAVLMHELAHIRRRDLLGHTLGRLVCAVYWFHPLVWTAVRRMRIESERACDDLALTCGLKATSYAEHLLDIVSSVGKTRTPAIAIPMAHRREFEGRMLAILDPDLRRGLGRGQSYALIAGLVAFVVVVGAAVPAQRAAPPSANQMAGAPVTSDAQGDTAPLQEITLGGDTSAARVAERKQESPRPQPNPVSSPESARDAYNRVAADPKPDPSLLQAIMQDTGRDDRPGLLISVLRRDSSANLRRVAAWGLSRFADRADVATALATALRRDANAEVRETAAWALAQGEDRKEAIDALGEALRRDDNAEVRETAAWALGNLDAESAVEALTEALTAQSADLRMVAMGALGNAAPSKAPRSVLSALSDSDRGVRMLAAWTLFRIEDPETVPALEQALAREQDRDLRMAYIRALGAIGERSSAALARLIDSRDPEVRAVVVEALAGKGGGPWPWPWPRPRPFP